MQAEFKTILCNKWWGQTPGECYHGHRCNFIHDDYRIQTGPYEFTLVSPSAGTQKTELVDPTDTRRVNTLLQLVADPANLERQRTAETNAQQKAAKVQQPQPTPQQSLSRPVSVAPASTSSLEAVEAANKAVIEAAIASSARKEQVNPTEPPSAAAYHFSGSSSGVDLVKGWNTTAASVAKKPTAATPVATPVPVSSASPAAAAPVTAPIAEAKQETKPAQPEKPKSYAALFKPASSTTTTASASTQASVAPAPAPSTDEKVKEPAAPKPKRQPKREASAAVAAPASASSDADGEWQKVAGKSSKKSGRR